MSTVRDLSATLDYCMANESALSLAILEKKHDNARRGSGRKNSISKPTEAQAMWNMSSVGPVLVNDFWYVEQPERTLSAIRYTKAHYNLDKKYGIIYRARYLDKEKWDETCEKLMLAPSTYYDRVKVIVDYAVDTWTKLRCLDSKELSNEY